VENCDVEISQRHCWSYFPNRSPRGDRVVRAHFLTLHGWLEPRLSKSRRRFSPANAIDYLGEARRIARKNFWLARAPDALENYRQLACQATRALPGDRLYRLLESGRALGARRRERRSGAYAPLEQGCLTVGHCSGDLLLEGAGADELRQAECREWQLAWGANRTANQASNHVRRSRPHAGDPAARGVGQLARWPADHGCCAARTRSGWWSTALPSHGDRAERQVRKRAHADLSPVASALMRLPQEMQSKLSFSQVARLGPFNRTKALPSRSAPKS
jgi:hypothetical protein